MSVACRVPTTLDAPYTAVPLPTDFALFRDAHVDCLSGIFDAGVQIYHAVSDTCRADFEKGVYGAQQPSYVVLMRVNGWSLELHMPEGKPPVLAAIPPEHLSHIMWQMLREESRLWVLEGGVKVHAVLAALLGATPPDVDKLLGLIVDTPHVGWISRNNAGAYAEAVMKTVRRMQYHHVYGPEVGEKKWAAYYYGAKSRAGEPSRLKRSHAISPPRAASPPRHTRRISPRSARAPPRRARAHASHGC
jgi:hypothetical protein